MLTLTCAGMRLAERLADEAGLSFEQMMKNAGEISYEFLNQKLSLRTKTCAVLAGVGNNAGDGFVIAKRLAVEGATVTIILCDGAPEAPLAKARFSELSAYRVNIINGQTAFETAALLLSSVEIIIDAVYGTGFHGEIKGSPKKLIESANKSSALKVSLDIPSGIEGDGESPHSVFFKADYTLAYGAYKPAHHLEATKNACGRVALLDIGIPEEIIKKAISQRLEITREAVSKILPKRDEWAHKGDFGSLLCICGSRGMGGAAMMATLAALRTGAGITRLVAPSDIALMTAPQLMEAMTIPLSQNKAGAIAPTAENLNTLLELLKKSTACLIGCGLSCSEDTKQIVEYIIKNTECNIILDADGLNCIVGNTDILKTARSVPVITPHIGEMARLVSMTTEQVTKHARDIALVFAREHRCVVVLKGHNTIIATPHGDLYENRTGNVALAKGGSGDVLAGMLASFSAQGISSACAAIAAVYIHGACADTLVKTMSNYGILARDIIAQIPVEMKRL